MVLLDLLQDIPRNEAPHFSLQKSYLTQTLETLVLRLSMSVVKKQHIGITKAQRISAAPDMVTLSR